MNNRKSDQPKRANASKTLQWIEVAIVPIATVIILVVTNHQNTLLQSQLSKEKDMSIQITNILDYKEKTNLTLSEKYILSSLSLEDKKRLIKLMLLDFQEWQLYKDDIDTEEFYLQERSRASNLFRALYVGSEQEIDNFLLKKSFPNNFINAIK